MTGTDITLLRVVLLFILVTGLVGHLFGGPLAIQRVMNSTHHRTHEEIHQAIGFIRCVRLYTLFTMVVLLVCCIVEQVFWR